MQSSSQSSHGKEFGGTSHNAHLYFRHFNGGDEEEVASYTLFHINELLSLQHNMDHVALRMVISTLNHSSYVPMSVLGNSKNL